MWTRTHRRTSSTLGPQTRLICISLCKVVALADLPDSQELNLMLIALVFFLRKAYKVKSNPSLPLKTSPFFYDSAWNKP